MHVLLRGGVQPRHRCVIAASFVFGTSTPSPQSDFRHLYAIDATLLRRGHWRVTSTPSPRQSELRKIPTSTPSPRSRTRAGDWRVDNAETIDRMFYGASAFDQDLGWCTLATVDRAFHTSPCQSNDCVLPCPSFPFLCLFSVAVTLRRRPWRGAYGRAIRSGPPDAIGAASRRRVRAQAASCAASVSRSRGRSERASPRRRRRRRPTRRGKSATAAPTTGGGAKITVFVSNRTQLSRTSTRATTASALRGRIATGRGGLLLRAAFLLFSWGFCLG